MLQNVIPCLGRFLVIRKLAMQKVKQLFLRCIQLIWCSLKTNEENNIRLT